jgi:hypothetical protein
MADSTLVSPADLHKYLICDFETGALTWRLRPREAFPCNWSFLVWNKSYGGKPAFTSSCSGYYRGNLLNKVYAAHRVIWAMAHNEWPEVIDHVNGNKLDNRLSNLRNVSQTINCKNTRHHKHNTSGVMGVSWSNTRNKWVARVGANTAGVHIGYFDDKESAIRAVEAERLKRGYHENHGRKTS